MSTPLERATTRTEELLTQMGESYTVSDITLGKMITASRGNYPQEIKIQLLETARGVGVKVRQAAWLKLILAHSPYLIFALLMIVQSWKPTSVIISGKVNLTRVFLGINSNPKYLAIAFLVTYAIFTGLEYVHVNIRASLIRRRLSLHLVGADWEPEEPSSLLQVILSISPMLWMGWLIASVYYFPLATASELRDAFLKVYNVGLAELITAVQTSIALVIFPAIGFIAGSRIYHYILFVTEVDKDQLQEEVLENYLAQLAGIGLGAGAVLVVLLSTFLGHVYLHEMNPSLLALVIGLTILATAGGVAISHFGKGWPHAAAALWLFFLTLWMIFANAKNAAYSWPIIVTLFLLPIPMLVAGHLALRKYVEMYGITEPSWLYSLVPLSAFIAFFVNSRRKQAFVLPTTEKETITVEKLRISMESIRQKGKDAEEIVNIYLRIANFLKEKGEEAYISMDAQVVKKRLRKRLKSYSELQKQIEEFLKVAERIIWDPKYQLEDKTGEEIKQIAQRILELVAEEA